MGVGCILGIGDYELMVIPPSYRHVVYVLDGRSELCDYFKFRVLTCCIPSLRVQIVEIQTLTM